MQRRTPGLWLLALLAGVLSVLAFHQWRADAAPSPEAQPPSASTEGCAGDTLRARMCTAATQGGFASIVGY